MKRFFLFVIACLVAMATAQAQTVVSRKIISAQKANDESPVLVQAGPGKYAIVWSRIISSSGEQLFFRVVSVNGNTAGAIHNNLLGTLDYPFTGHAAASLNGGGFVTAATRMSDRQLVLRFFNAAFQPRGATVATGITGYSPHLVQSGNGFLLVNSDGFVQSFVSLLDASGKKSVDPVHVVPPTAANGFSASRILTSPSGGFVVAGLERDAGGSKSRASSFFVTANLSTVSKPIAHESAFASSTILSDAAFSGQNALMLFGHAVSDSQTNLSMRLLGAKGQNAGGIKKLNTGGTTLSRYLRIVSLTGLNKYVVSWEDERGGLFLLQVLNANGAAVSDPFQLSPDTFTHEGPVDLAWDADSQTLLAAWTESSSQPAPHKNIWFGTFKINP